MNGKKHAAVLEKISSGIEGFDDITCGGLPLGADDAADGRCRVPGRRSSRSRSLVSATAHHGTPGIFVAFEENARRVVGQRGDLWLEYARAGEEADCFSSTPACASDVVKSGAFDLTGLLAALEAKAGEMGAKLIVFDAIDVLLSLLDDPAAECRELYRLHEWLIAPRADRHPHDESRGRPAGHLAALRLHAFHGRLHGAA